VLFLQQIKEEEETRLRLEEMRLREEEEALKKRLAEERLREELRKEEQRRRLVNLPCLVLSSLTNCDD
jgi:hypothetical protein